MENFIYTKENCLNKELCNKIIEYFELEEIVCGSELDDICDKYKLKLLYLYLHNEKISALNKSVE